MSIGVGGRQLLFKHPKTKVNTMFWLREEQLEVFYERMKDFLYKAENEGEPSLVNAIGTDWVQGLKEFAADKQIDVDEKATHLISQAEEIILESLEKTRIKHQALITTMQEEQEYARPEYNWQARGNGEIVSVVPAQKPETPWFLLAVLGLGGLVAYKFMKK